MNVSESFDLFLHEKRLQGLSSDSLESYRNLTYRFRLFVGFKTIISDITREMFDDYAIQLLSSGLSRSTVSTYISNAKIFLVWLYDNFDLCFDPHKIKVPKSPKKVVHILDDSEISVIFDSISCSPVWLSARNKAIISLMLDSGIRQIEVCTLKRSDFNFDRMVFKVSGKGSKDRFVPLGHTSLCFLYDYLLHCPFRDSDFLFVDRSGHPISRNAIRVFVNKLKLSSGIDLSSHKFRHNFATNYCIDNIKKNGQSNVYDLSILMGHESIETTKRYEHFAHEMIAAENHFSHLDSVLLKNQVSLEMSDSEMKKTLKNQGFL